MPCRLLNLLTLVSLAILASAAVLWGVSMHPSVDYRRYVALGGDVRAAVHRGKVSLYNSDLPYNGGIIAIGPSPGVSVSAIDFPVYYRHIRWPQTTMWVVTAPLSILVLASAPLPLLWLRRRLASADRRSRNQCAVCGYDLRATPDRCPECGTSQHFTKRTVHPGWEK